MAETEKQNRKKTTTATTKKSSSSAKSSGTKKATAASKAPASKKKSGGKSTKSRAQTEAQKQRKSEFTVQFLPYILAVVVIFLVICLILDAVGGAQEPEDHLMGILGFYFCQFLFGCFGWSAYLIPVFLINLIIFWKRNYEDGSIPVKSILSVVTLIMVAAVSHVVCCAINEDVATMTAIDELYETGFDFQSGGVVGGLLGFLLYEGLRLPGTIVLSVLVFPLLIMYLIGVTPSYVFGKLSEFIKVQMAKSAEARELRRAEEAEAEEEEYEDEEDEDEEDEDESEDDETEEDDAPAKLPLFGGSRDRRSAKDSAASGKTNRRGSAAREDDENVDDADEPEDIRTSEDDNIVVNPRTGEVLGSAAKRGNRKKSRDDSVMEEPAGLPFYDSPDEDDEEDDEAPFDEDTPYISATAASVMEDTEEEEGMETDTMEVGYDDDFNDQTAPATRGNGNRPTNQPARKPRQQKPDPYSSVRILESETAAVAEAGLSEEEIVISSARADLPNGMAPADDAAESMENAEAVEPVEEEVLPPREYVFPPVDLLTKGSSRYEANEEEIAENTEVLREVLESFHIRIKEISCSCGPTITRFEVKPDSGVRVRSIANLVDDIAMGLAKAGVRIEAPIPGKAAVGIEVPNAEPATVYFRNILETPEFRNHKSRVAACLGADVSGRPVILDINKMPHLLVAGTTGSGKSVCINSIIMSILYKAKPEEVKLILIDPKKVEFAVYRDLPHLYCPIISDPKKAAGALNSAVNEMERRFELIEEVGVRNIAGYNEVTANDPARPAMPQMVIIIDELADLMMTASNEVETAICRLAQKARAAGMHLILGTQRPSTDVITGLIKANVPSRIAFTVTQSIDSRIIIDTVGAEKLIGRGDMLYSPVGTTKPLRVQGTFISDSEVEKVVTFLRENNDRVEFDESFTRQIEIEAAKCAAGNKKKGGSDPVDIDDIDIPMGGGGGGGAVGGRKDNEDPKFWEALEVAAGKEKIGTSALQRALNLGYGRAAKIIDRMEELGLVGPDPGTKQGRKVLITKQQYLEYRANGLPTNGGGGASDGDVGDSGDFDDL